MTGTKIYLQPEDVWAFYYANAFRLRDEMALLAENTESDVRLYLAKGSGDARIYAYRGDLLVESDELWDMADCVTTCTAFYERYLSASEDDDDDDDDESLPYEILYTDDEDEDVPPENQEDDVLDEIYQREDQLTFAFRDFLQEVLMENEEAVSHIKSEVLNDMLESCLEAISSAGFPIYRPTITEDPATGLEYVEEFPYEST